jgi:sugar lactone lactonase YvrE
MKHSLTLFAAALATCIAVAAAAAAPRPDAYVLPGQQVFPEGVAYWQGTDTFFVGSTTDGTIFRGNLNDPETTVFSPGGFEGRTAAVGMKVDKHGRLIVDGGATGLVSVLDAHTGQLIRKFSTNFTGAQFLNDVVVAKNGDAFITDSMRPVLYRIPAGELRPASGTAPLEAWLDFTGTPLQYQPGFNLNGIVATANGKYLIVTQSNTGKLFRITIATKEVVEIQILGGTVAGDGLWLRGQTLWAVVRPEILKLKLRHEFTVAEIVKRTTPAELKDPTTIAIAKGRMLVVNSQFGNRTSPVLPFTVSSIPVP